MADSIRVLHNADIDAFLPSLDVPGILEKTFAALHEGRVAQPPQSLTLFPENRGDVITYQGVLGHFDVFGAKLSPYIPADGGAIITAWTLLMSMETGQPLVLCDAGRLTLERTAATTSVAVRKLARPESRILGVIGSGAQAFAHLRYVLPLRNWEEVRVYSPHLIAKADKAAQFTALDPRIRVLGSAAACADSADVLLLTTASGAPVIDSAAIGQQTLVTSISTNVARAHEIDPAMLPHMDVYCDYAATSPESAGEMVLATEAGIWSKERILGDLPALCTASCPLPAYDKPVFFRSIGLGIEDIAIAYAIYKASL